MPVPTPLPTAPYDPLTARERELLFCAADYLTTDDKQLLEKACAYAFHAHDGQTRKSGEPYITHPLAVAAQLAAWHMDVQGLCAGVMHDVLEDTGVTKLEMTAEFGETIAEMVDGLSKLEKLEYNDQAEHQAESFRKLILAMTKDIRVIVIKLSDRLHNMRTLGSMRPEKRRRIAQETLEIYAQIANRIGLNSAYQELQDLSFQNLHPRRYETLQKAMKASRRNRRDVVGKVLRAFSQRLVSANIEAKIKGREKNLYSIHQKMQSKNLRFAEVMDIYGFRVIVNSVPACYAALGALHSLYQPKPGRIKDYIAIPKSNGYQSLHTTLVGPYGLPIEVQIRTREMDAVAEGGIAGHWIYKSGENTIDQATLRTNQWLQNILDLQARSSNAMEFLEHVKVDLFPDEVYILTPKGKILVLPEGATPIDFAYAVHTDIGNRTVAARVNNTMMPLRTALKTGDTVEIITSEHAKPNAAWLNFAVSSRARSAIRNYIKNMNRQDAILLGENLLQKALSSLLPQNVLLSDDLKEKYLTDLNNKQTSFEDVLYNVGMGHTLPVSVAMHIAELAGEHFGDEVKLSPIKINGNETGRVHLAQCCNPIPGDSIRAVIIKDQGMIIHRDTCPNVLKADLEQQLEADWDSIHNRTYRTSITAGARDTHGLLAAMAQAISGANADIESVETPSQKQAGTEGFIEFKFFIKTKNLEQLNEIIRALYAIPHVRRVVRN
ncbi:guanosine-3',5'-bis(diphosphate) 3'-pyrophosphohydrolase [Neisseria arctica]|uniref:Guanosine-3',5'-bis(Diphosphate) 3'-pyrophosphohydrolase n=1 Tax=Neisseria arctica TaxID=1470200 RepID=A0A0J0YQI9_9NEIS|nr:bifunctional (p)ppGpp synthetase/guanosine-3',5'-bis(diphosphate) 3'-pyrophosphohydrolase [Neisseria arctica]KLT72382.1 guanosine-3',5'-bis(diphosphate) 3'-pyrophosphohydrolase [Neisseria arctica]UOO86046.1 bifunctional (p)ppGpp synthetase/guanosine-3',5'-bis(diphosphate) 3'-pyrophosphohydrolase [Neisseria arctica]